MTQEKRSHLWCHHGDHGPPPPPAVSGHTAAGDGSPKAVVQGLGSQSKKLAVLAVASKIKQWALEPATGQPGPAVLLCPAGATEERPVHYFQIPCECL